MVGLGNPGPQYIRTRHNAGFAVLALLAERHGVGFRRLGRGVPGESARLRLGEADVLLLRPLTFMNLSGDAVGPVCRREGLGPQQLLLVYDDMDLPLGSLRLRPDGGAGGHRGVASVQAMLGASGLARVRVGIGRPPVGVDAAEHVLGSVAPQDRPTWEEALGRAADAVEAVCTLGLELAMVRFNRPGVM